MQFYFTTQAVDILYGTLCARGLAYYGTEGESSRPIGILKRVAFEFDPGVRRGLNGY